MGKQMPAQKEDKSLKREVVDLLSKWQPTNVVDLMTMLHEKRGINATDVELADVLKELKDERILNLEPVTHSQKKLSSFLLVPELTGDFWGIVASLAILNAIISSPASTLFVPVRLTLGTLSILLFPGYTLQMTLFPRTKDLLLWKRIVLALGLSIAVTGFYAVVLDATPQGIVLGSILLVFSVHTLIFACIGLLRRFEAQRD